MKLLNLFFKIISVFLAVVVIAVIVFASTFDVNNYKTEIIEQVENKTGRDFNINGEINLSLFPWIGFKIEDVTMGNAEGFKAAQFAAIKNLDIKVHLLPLLKKEVEVKKLALRGLDLSLEVAKDKSNNWSSIASANEAQVSEQEKPEKEAKTGDAGSAISFLSIKGFEFSDSVIHYDDRSTNTTATLSELNLLTGALEFDLPTDVDFSARVENNQPVIDTRLKATTQLTFNKALTKFNLHEFVFSAVIKKNEFIQQEEKIEIKTSIDVLMDKQLASLKKLEIKALGITSVADLSVEFFLKTPLIKGNIEVLPFNAKEVAKRVIVDLPEMANNKALQAVSLKTTLKSQGETLEANDLVLSLDNQTLRGWVHVVNLAKQKIKFDLALDKFNLDDYLPADVQAQNGKSSIDSSNAAVSDSQISGNEKIELPTEMLRSLDIQGDLRIAQLVAKTYEIQQMVMSTQASNGVINIKPMTMEMLGGKVTTAVNVNVQNAVPRYALNLNAAQVKVGPVVNPFLKDVMGDKPAEVDGAVDLKIDVKTAGETINDLKKASSGPVTLDMKQTRVNNFDPEFYMRSSLNNYFSAKGLDLSKKLMRNYKPNDVTVFDTIHGMFNLAQGKIQTSDFLMDSDRVQVGAQGYADIVQNSLDVLTSIDLPSEKAAPDSSGVAVTSPEKSLHQPLYVRVKGPFDALEYKLDTERLKKALSDAAKNEAKAKLEAEKQKVKVKVEAERDRAKEKAEQKVQEKTDVIKDKLKDKLKGLF